MNIKKINDLYLESLKEKIHDIEENELAYLYDYLVELNKHIKLLNFYKLSIQIEFFSNLFLEISNQNSLFICLWIL